MADFAYKMTLTRDEFDSLGFFADRWEAPSLLWQALTPINEDTGEYGIHESDAWEFNESFNNDGWPCLNWSSNLGEKVLQFINSIV